MNAKQANKIASAVLYAIAGFVILILASADGLLLSLFSCADSPEVSLFFLVNASAQIKFNLKSQKEPTQIASTLSYRSVR